MPGRGFQTDIRARWRVRGRTASDAALMSTSVRGWCAGPAGWRLLVRRLRRPSARRRSSGSGSGPAPRPGTRPADPRPVRRRRRGSCPGRRPALRRWPSVGHRVSGGGERRGLAQVGTRRRSGRCLGRLGRRFLGLGLGLRLRGRRGLTAPQPRPRPSAPRCRRATRARRDPRPRRGWRPRRRTRAPQPLQVRRRAAPPVRRPCRGSSRGRSRAGSGSTTVGAGSADVVERRGGRRRGLDVEQRADARRVDVGGRGRLEPTTRAPRWEATGSGSTFSAAGSSRSRPRQRSASPCLGGGRRLGCRRTHGLGRSGRRGRGDVEQRPGRSEVLGGRGVRSLGRLRLGDSAGRRAAGAAGAAGASRSKSDPPEPRSAAGFASAAGGAAGRFSGVDPAWLTAGAGGGGLARRGLHVEERATGGRCRGRCVSHSFLGGFGGWLTARRRVEQRRPAGGLGGRAGVGGLGDGVLGDGDVTGLGLGLGGHVGGGAAAAAVRRQRRTRGRPWWPARP